MILNIGLAIMGTALCTFLIARSARIAGYRRIARGQITQDHNGTPITGQAGVSPNWVDTTNRAEMAAYGSVTLAELLWGWFSIDPSLIQAADFSSVEHISNGFEFANYIHHSYDSLSAAAKDGFLSRLSGYVAEQHVTTALQHAGHAVQVAETANQPVWDLLVDGHAVNVKDVTSLAEIKAAALAHPSVQYLVPDHLQHTAALPNVHPLPGFNHDAIKESLKHGVSAAHGEGAMHSMAHHLPWITIGFAVYRNYKLVRDYGQEPIVAVGHGILESVGRGTGVVVGGKVGAAAGFAVGGPIGAIIGGVGLAIVGAMAGGAAAEKFKSGPLRAAMTELEAELHAFGESYRCKMPAIREFANAPVKRAEEARTRLSSELDRRKSDWRVRLWPDLYTVTLTESLSVASTAVSSLREQRTTVLTKLSEIERGGNWRILGVMMANSPELRSKFGFSPVLLNRVATLREKVLRERKRLNPKLDIQ